MSKEKGRRKLANLVVDIRSLAHLSIPFLVMITMSIGVVFMVQREVMQALEKTVLFGVENLETMNALHDMQNTVTKIGFYGLIILALVCLGLWVVFSHRIFGPTIPIRRHIRNLISGDYASRIHLRAGDEFKDLVEELNHLAEVLEHKGKS